MKEMISKLVTAKRDRLNPKKKRAAGTGPAILEDEEIFTYENLPFQDSHIFNFFPILKTIPF
jgi:hypothetical protein